MVYVTMERRVGYVQCASLASCTFEYLFLRLLFLWHRFFSLVYSFALRAPRWSRFYVSVQ